MGNESKWQLSIQDLVPDYDQKIKTDELKDLAWNRSWFTHFAFPITAKAAVNFATGATAGAVAGAVAGAGVGGLAGQHTLGRGFGGGGGGPLLLPQGLSMHFLQGGATDDFNTYLVKSGTGTHEFILDFKTYLLRSIFGICFVFSLIILLTLPFLI